MDRINEIGDTPKGQYALGQVYARANKRRSGITDAWTKQMPKKEYYTAAEYYPKGTEKYDDIIHNAKSEAECPPNRKVNMKPVVYNDKGYETTNFGLGIMDYEKSHKTNENKQYTNMNKKQIRLTESDLKQIVKESVGKILSEAYGTPDAKTQKDVDYIRRNNSDYGQLTMILKNLFDSVVDFRKKSRHCMGEEVKLQKAAVKACDDFIDKMQYIMKLYGNKQIQYQGEQPDEDYYYKHQLKDKRGGYGSSEMFEL